MFDENKDEDLQKLHDAINSDEGQLIIEYLVQEINEAFDFENIDDEKLTDEQAGREFKSIKKIKQFFKGLLIFNNPQE